MILCFQYAILKSQSRIFGMCNIYFQANSIFFQHQNAFENLKKDILRDESSDTPEDNNDSVKDSYDDEDEAEEHEEQLDIQYET